MQDMPEHNRLNVVDVTSKIQIIEGRPWSGKTSRLLQKIRSKQDQNTTCPIIFLRDTTEEQKEELNKIFAYTLGARYLIPSGMGVSDLGEYFYETTKKFCEDYRVLDKYIDLYIDDSCIDYDSIPGSLAKLAPMVNSITVTSNMV